MVRVRVRVRVLGRVMVGVVRTNLTSARCSQESGFVDDASNARFAKANALSFSICSTATRLARM